MTKTVKLKIALTVSFFAMAVAAYALPPEYGMVLAFAGAGTNTVWLWEV